MQRQANIVVSHNPFTPTRGREVVKVDEGYSIQHWVNGQDELFQHPVICVIDGHPRMREEWGSTCIYHDDVVVFYKLPLSGGDFNPVQFFVGIALVVVGAFTYNPGLISYGLIGLGLGIAVLGSGLLAPPEIPSVDQANQLARASPTYSLTGQGNTARLNSSIPVIYGRHRVFPDFAATPWSEFDNNNDQYLYHLLLIGQGEYDISKINIEDTRIRNFSGVTSRIIRPGEDVTLFNTNVVNSLEVSGQQSASLGPFTINPAETEINKIQIDIVFPGGLYDIGGDGDFAGASVIISYSYQEIDDEGERTSKPFVTTKVEIGGNNNTAMRETISFDVPPGRYEIRLRYTIPDAPDGTRPSDRVVNKFNWQGVKGFYTDGPTNFGDVTMLAIRMRATNSLSSRSSRKINCIAQRKIPVWIDPTFYNNGRTRRPGYWSDPQATSSIAWAMADALRNMIYGAGWDDARIDIEGFAEVDKVLTARGDFFNGVFDRKLSLWEGLKLIARVGRCAVILQGGVFHLVRDRLQTIPTAFFSPQNIADGSFSVEYSLASEDTVNGLDVEYINAKTWKPAHVLANEDGDKPTSPAKVKLFGCTDKAQARREAIYLSRNNIYRRRLIKFTTELEGHIPAYGDLVIVSHDVPRWGQSGNIVDADPDSGIITLSEYVDMTPTNEGKYMMAFRGREGEVLLAENGDNITIDDEGNGIGLTYDTSLEVSNAGDDPITNKIRITKATETVAVGGFLWVLHELFIMDRGELIRYDNLSLVRLYYSNASSSVDYEPTQFTFGLNESWRQLGVVKSIKPRGDFKVELQILSEDARVHEEI